MPKTLRIYTGDDPMLRLKCRDVERIEPWVSQLCEDMWLTMQSANGVGLAANQVGFDYRIIAVDTKRFSGIMINPVIEVSSDELFDYEEQCLSLPDLQVLTGKRSKDIACSNMVSIAKNIIFT